jgi:hypothetical protein
MNVIGLSGWSGAGKTTLLTRVIPHLLAKGLRVSVIKHAHHEFDVDVPGKDSWVHRQSGATEVLVSSTRRWALMHELRGAAEPRLPELLGRISSSSKASSASRIARSKCIAQPTTSRCCFPTIPISSASRPTPWLKPRLQWCISTMSRPSQP